MKYCKNENEEFITLCPFDEKGEVKVGSPECIECRNHMGMYETPTEPDSKGSVVCLCESKSAVNTDLPDKITMVGITSDGNIVVDCYSSVSGISKSLAKSRFLEDHPNIKAKDCRGFEPWMEYKIDHYIYKLQNKMYVNPEDMHDYFLKYIAIQLSGSYNMITDREAVAKLIGVTDREYTYLISAYKELKKLHKSEYRAIEIAIMTLDKLKK